MSNITELLDAFDEAARDWGWQAGNGFISVEKSRADYFKTRQALLDAIRGLERGAERYRWLRDQHWVEPEARFRLGLSSATEDDAELFNMQLNAAIDAILYPVVDIDAVHRSKE